MAKTKGVKSDSNEKTANKKIAKPRVVKKQLLPIPEMVMSVMTTHKDGCTLQTIRNTIKKEFGAKLTQKFQLTLKDYLTKEFEDGRIRMVDNDTDQIKFNEKLQVVEK